MEKTKRILRYIKLHFFKNTRYILVYFVQYFNPDYVPDINYLTSFALVNQLKQGKSLIRIGDGEVYIMNFGKIGYQEYDPKLRDIFFKIIKEYKEDSSYVIGLNKIPISKSNKQLKRDGLFHCWLPMKVYWTLYFKKFLKYFDATLFYYNETFPEYFEEYLKNKHLVLVTNKANIDKFKNNELVPFRDVSFVETPDVNAFSAYDIIKSEVLRCVNRRHVDQVVVLAACGPASKALAYELSKDGIVTIDVGRGIEVAYTPERIDQIIYPANQVT